MNGVSCCSRNAQTIWLEYIPHSDPTKCALNRPQLAPGVMASEEPRIATALAACLRNYAFLCQAGCEQAYSSSKQRSGSFGAADSTLLGH